MNITTRDLSNLENEILDRIVDETGVPGKTTTGENVFAYIVWVDENGVQFGPVRWAHKQNYHFADGHTEDSWSASPFPGGWTMVPRSQIIRVRHGKAI
jgi:hypothetical protein